MKKMYDIKDPDGIILRDYLARDRTMLANERTFLAYFRTALGLFSAGIAAVKFISDEPIIYYVGICMIAVAPIALFVGIYRFITVRKLISAIPDNDLLKK